VKNQAPFSGGRRADLNRVDANRGSASHLTAMSDWMEDLGNTEDHGNALGQSCLHRLAQVL